jgi:hypothetical protein
MHEQISVRYVEHHPSREREQVPQQALRRHPNRNNDDSPERGSQPADDAQGSRGPDMQLMRLVVSPPWAVSKHHDHACCKEEDETEHPAPVEARSSSACVALPDSFCGTSTCGRMAAQALPDELSKLIEKHGLTPHEEGGWFRQ